MPRTPVPVTASKSSGTLLPAPTAGDPVNEMTIPNSGNTRFIATNTGATPRVLEVVVTRTVDGQTAAPKTKTLAAGEAWLFGPYPRADYGPNIQVNVDHAEVTLRAIE